MLKPSTPNRNDYAPGPVGDALFEERKRQFQRDMKQFEADPEGYGGARYIPQQDPLTISAESEQRLVEAMRIGQGKK